MLLRDVPLRLLLLLAFLVSGLIPLMAASLASYSAARSALTDQALQQLESVRDIKKSQIERFFQEQARRMEVLASGSDARLALHAFRAWHQQHPGQALAGHREGRFAASEAYKRIHDGFFPYFHHYAERYHYYDVFLLDPEGFTLFTVVKEEDFGVSISEVDSSLRDVWRTVRDEDRVALSDTRPYEPSADDPAQFVAAPVLEEGELLGVVAAQISLEAIDAIMGERSGMGLTGETYLVGPDLRMRSDSWRDPQRRSVLASSRGTVAENGVDTPATRAAVAGHTGADRLLGPRGEPVLSAYAPVHLQGVEWAIVAEIDAAEIEDKGAAALNARITFISALSIITVVLMGLLLSAFITRGIGAVDAEIGLLVDRVLQGRLSARGDPDRVSWDMRTLVRKTNDLVVAFARQTAEARRLEEVVQYNQRMESIGTLAGGIAHDFNNILMYMTTYGELVADRLRPDTPEAGWMEEIMSAVDRGAELVGQILTFGRQLREEKRPVEIALMVTEAVKLLRATIPRSIELHRDIRAPELRLMADPTHLHQVIMNLCTNAFHAMHQTGGTLTVALDRAELEEDEVPGVSGGAYALLEVRDTGCGMDEATLERVFEPFFTTKSLGQGTGMGMAVVHGIVTSYHGHIRIQSSPGEGTAVRVYLPLRESSLDLDAPQPILEATPGQGLVLFVDDEPAICESMRLALEELGYQVETEVDPLRALSRFQAQPDRWDLILTDLNMPGLGGVDLTRQIKALRPHLPVIMTTGYDQALTAESAQEHGAFALVLKPVHRAELSRVMAEALEARSLIG